MKRWARHLLAASLLLSVAPARAGDAVGPVGAGYQPQDKDERGLWMQMDEAERDVKTSEFVIRDPALNAYVRGVFCRTVGQEACKDTRLYIMRTPYFNATMAPNGMMQVWSGALLRVRDEAQLAAILGHEYTHYQNKHSVKNFRNLKQNTAAASLFLIVPFGGLASLAILASYYGYSQDQEREADSGGVALMAKAGYDPAAAAQIWEQERQEREATASARDTKPRYSKGGLYSDHPSSLERMNALRDQAAKLNVPGAVRNEAAYRAALSPWWPQFVDDQIKLNDFGGTDLLLGQLAAAGWTPNLLFARGELYRTRGRPDDLTQAAAYYRQAIAAPDAPVEAYRGLGLALLRGGDKALGRAALGAYLQKKPDAPDKAMMAMLAGGPS